MTFKDIPVPSIYKESADFRFFLNWIDLCLSKLQDRTDNLIDLLDPLRCPKNLLWMLADTVGYKYDERASIAFNRLVIKYFATLIMNRGSHTGMTYGAELNLAQFNLQKYAEENPILEDRLEDTSLPANSTSITAFPELGYIDIVYYSENIPTDICLEYVRPIGMYCFTHAGVVVNARTKISIDARLTNMNDKKINDPGPSFVGHYRRADYASLQTWNEFDELSPRRPVYYRNMDSEPEPASFINPGYRSLFSLQLCNNEHIVKALMPSLENYDEIFSLGYDPQQVGVTMPDDYLKNPSQQDKYKPYNLRVDRNLEESFTPSVYTLENAESVIRPKPAVNPVMFAFGDAISLNDDNKKYTKVKQDTGEIIVVSLDDTPTVLIPPTIISAQSNYLSITLSYTIPRLNEGFYQVIKLIGKKNRVPSTIDDGDIIMNLVEPTSPSRIDQVIINELDKYTTYYFVIFVEDNQGNKSNSSPENVATGGWVDAPVISALSVSGTDITASFTITEPPTSTLVASVLGAKKNIAPISVSDCDATLSVSASDTTATITGLDEQSEYYFVIFLEDNLGNEASSNVESATTGRLLRQPTIVQLAAGAREDWDGSEIDVIWSGQYNNLTVQIDDGHIVFKMYTSGVQIYSFTSPIGSTTADIADIQISFLIDEDDLVAKPSFIYETATDTYSYNLEDPTDAEMAAIYGWLSSGLIN